MTINRLISFHKILLGFLPVVIFSAFFTNCTEDNNPVPNIYKSGLWSSQGKYNIENQQFEARILVTVNSIDTIPLENRLTTLQVPDSIKVDPVQCYTDQVGKCLFELSSSNQITTTIYGFVETDNLADSTTQASKKSYQPLELQMVKIAWGAPLFFEVELELENAIPLNPGWELKLILKDAQGYLPQTDYQLQLRTSQTLLESQAGTTDSEGYISIQTTHDSTQNLEYQLLVPGIEDPTLSPLIFK